MRMPRSFLSGVVLLFSSATICGQDRGGDWRAFRGNDGSGTSPAKGLPLTWGPKENIVWKTNLPGAGSSTPIVVGSRVFVTYYTGYNVPGQPRGSQENLKLHLACLDRADGNILWTRDIPAKTPEQENIRDGHGYVSSTPVADDNRVFAFFGKSGVWAFDHKGKELWNADVGSKVNGFGSGTSLLLYDNLLIVNGSVESETLYALDASSGKEVWKLGRINESWNTPILAKNPAGKTELVLAKFGKVLGVDPKTGKELWNSATDIPWYMVPSLVAHEGVVYAIGGRPGGGLAVRMGGSGDVTKTHRLWTSKKGGNVSSPLYHNGHLYWMHDNMGIAFCADAKTGAVVYEERLPRAEQVYGSPVLANGKIYYPGRNGVTYVVAAQPKFELLASNSWGERGEFNASPAIAGDQFFLRTNRFVCCVGSK